MKHPVTSLLTAAALLFTPLTVYADGESCGSDGGIQWTLEDHVLTLSGSGTLPADNGKAPSWKGCAEDIYEIVIDEGITGAETRALSGLPHLQKLTLPSTFRSLRPYALADDPELIEIEGLTYVTQYDYRCLSGTAYIGEHPFIISEGKLYYAECTDFDVPEGVTEIMPFAFGNLTGKEFITAEGVIPVSVTLPEGVEIIRENAFAFCAGLTEINIPDSVTRIGSRAFYDCVHLGNLTLGEHLEAVGSQAFFNCKSLNQLTILNSNAVLGKDAYGTCFDWRRALNARRARYASEEAFQKALADLEAKPLAMDEELANFAVHFWSTRAYGSIKFNSYDSHYYYRTGLLIAPADSTVQDYAHENAIPFRPLDGSVLPGDVNLDDLVDIIDVIWLNKYQLGCQELSERALLAADFDADGTIDETDSLVLLRYVIGIANDSKD